MKNLKTLEESNSDNCTQWEEKQHSIKFNGIACPICGYELIDSNPMIILPSSPPQTNVHCSLCDYKGYRIV